MKRHGTLVVLAMSVAGLVFSGRLSGDENRVDGPEGANANAGPPVASGGASLAISEPPEAFFDKMRPAVKEAARKYYKKWLSVKGIPIGASAEVSDDALRRTHEIVSHMLANRPDIVEEMVKVGTRLIIIGKDQVYSDMPEYKSVPNPQFMNERVRGTGGLDVCSFGEENLLNLAADRYDDESIAVHEFSHTIDAALRRIDPKFSQRLREDFESSTSSGLWKNTYAGSNRAEYWAETVTMYFDCERPNNWNHGPVATREQLKMYDPAQYELIRDTFRLTAENDWRFQPLRKQPSVISPPEKLKLNPYYTKLTYAREFPVVGSNHVSDDALLKANDTVRKMFAYRHDILKAMIEAGARLVVLGRDENLSDLPEFRDSKAVGGFDQPRYLEFTPERKIMVVPEENVLGQSSDRFARQCITVHMMAKGLWQIAGQRPVDPDFDKRPQKQQYELRVKRLDVEFDHQLQKCFEEVAGKGLWKGSPAARDRGEYWAAGVDAYFDASGDGYAPVGAERPITTRELLVRYDPGLYALVDETMAYQGHVDWRFKEFPPVAESTRSADVKAASRPAETPTSAATRGRIASAPAVFKTTINPHWFHDNTRFWYRNDLADGTKEFILVDAIAATRRRAFDHARLAAALSEAASAHYDADRLPFDSIDFIGDATIRFTTGGVPWKCNLGTYRCERIGDKAEPGASNNGAKSPQAADPQDEPSAPVSTDAERSPEDSRDRSPPPADDAAPQDVRPTPRGENRPDRRFLYWDRVVRSPDGKWSASIKEQNVHLTPAKGGEETALSKDGKPGLEYGRLQWSPDSSALVAFRIEPGDDKEVYRIETSPRGGGRAVLHARPYALPGDKLATFELNLFAIDSKKQMKPEVDRIDLDEPNLHWEQDGRHFTYLKVDRGHQRLRIVEVDSHTGEARNIIDETSPTFIWTAHTENLHLRLVNYLDRTNEIIYVSEKDGWRHLYLVDVAAGTIKNQITKGPWIIRGIDKIDEEKRQIWFQASGVYPDQDPYLIHYGRVSFDGSGLAFLTSANGNHSIAYSPDQRFFIDTYSRADMPPIHELHRTDDGKLVCELEKADVSQSDWRPPEAFVAKGRDGKTDIWGLIYRPTNFDPHKKYPIIEDIYAGPQGSFVPKSFRPRNPYLSLNRLGFIVVKIDGMGTANRSKAFHDVCWQNLKDGGFPDRILWIKAAAAKHPYMDLELVGIYGTSAGAQNAAAAVLFHPEFYKAAVANSGCHDNRMDKASWNEQWMGYPVGPCYSACSNIDNAAKLRGSLMLVVGEMDDNVPPESTYRFVDALIRADKDFELLVVPGGGHGAGGAYGRRRLEDFFVRHFQGIEPPNHNAASRAIN